MPDGRMISSAPVPAPQASTAMFRFAARIASRSEQLPFVVSSSAVVVTVMTAARAGIAVKTTHRTMASERPRRLMAAYQCQT